MAIQWSACITTSGPGAPEPALDPAGAELGLVGDQVRGRSFEVAERRLAAHERHVDLRDLVVAELQVAHAAPVVVRRLARAPDLRADRVRHDGSLALRK